MKVQEAIDRPSQRWAEDGVVEMTLGVQLFLMGVLCLSWKLPVGIPWLTVLPFLITGRVIQLLKERVVAPRAGYVVPREEELEIRVSSQGIKIDKASQRMLIITGALVVWTLGLLVLIPNRMFPHLPGRWQGMVGVWIAVSLAFWFAWIAWRQKTSRYAWLAALALALGGWAYVSHGDPLSNVLLMLTCLAGGVGMAGAVRFRSFLQANPRIEE